MAERKSQNMYYPPDWDPSKGSVNKFLGQHPLRDRAKKISQGILVIRFEMPYNIWCGGCNSHIGMGVRYNAEKKKVGNYYSTPIWQFRMKCHLCDNYFEINTDPQNHDYVIVSGARRKEQRWKPEENGQVATEDKAIIKKMASDAMFKLEHTSDDVKKSTGVQMSVGQLEIRRSEYLDDYGLNKLARSKFREVKKAQKKTQMEDKDLLQRSSLEIDLLPKSEEDSKLASLLKYKSLQTYDEKQAQRRKEIESQTIFQETTPKGKESLRKKLSLANSKHLGFTNETINFRTLKETQRLLGIQKRNKKNVQQRTEKSETVNSQETVSTDKDSDIVMECQTVDNKSNLCDDGHLTKTTDKTDVVNGNSECENVSSLMCTVSADCESVMATDSNAIERDTTNHCIDNPASSANVSSLSLVGIYQDSEDTDSECDSS